MERLRIVAGVVYLEVQLNRGVLQTAKGILMALRSSPHRLGIALLELLYSIDRL
jgi:hypothetical protein